MKSDHIKTACAQAAKFVQEATALLAARENPGTHPKQSGARGAPPWS